MSEPQQQYALVFRNNAVQDYTVCNSVAQALRSQGFNVGYAGIGNRRGLTLVSSPGIDLVTARNSILSQVSGINQKQGTSYELIPDEHEGNPSLVVAHGTVDRDPTGAKLLNHFYAQAQRAGYGVRFTRHPQRLALIVEGFNKLERELTEEIFSDPTGKKAFGQAAAFCGKKGIDAYVTDAVRKYAVQFEDEAELARLGAIALENRGYTVRTADLASDNTLDNEVARLFLSSEQSAAQVLNRTVGDHDPVLVTRVFLDLNLRNQHYSGIDVALSLTDKMHDGTMNSVDQIVVVTGMRQVDAELKALIPSVPVYHVEKYTGSQGTRFGRTIQKINDGTLKPVNFM